MLGFLKIIIIFLLKNCLFNKMMLLWYVHRNQEAFIYQKFALYKGISILQRI